MVVGAGIAGLVCATELARAGKSVVVFEAAETVGGRVRTARINGCAIDHGFQVLFTAYPVLASYLNLSALELRKFRPAAHVVTADNASLVGDAFSDPTLLLQTIASRNITVADKLRLLALRRLARSLSIQDCFSGQFRDSTIRSFLAQRGFSKAAIDGFFAPFYGGILLDRTLSTSASLLLFTFKMLSEGDTAIPAAGMGAIPEQLASRLPAGTVRTSSPVRALRADAGRIAGVVLADGTAFEATDVVIATEPAAAVTLAGSAGVRLHENMNALGSTSLYFVSDRAALPGRSLWLNAEPEAVISHAVTLTEIAPEYAPGKHLLVATAVGEAAALDDKALDESARAALSRMMRVGTAESLPELSRVAIMRIPYAQFSQPPGFTVQQPVPDSAPAGLWRASELMHSSSLEGAARGGQSAARALLARNAGT